MVLRGMGDEPVTAAHTQSITFQQEDGVWSLGFSIAPCL